MAKELLSHQPAYESEFWKRYRIMKAMLSHIEQQETLLLGLKHEYSIPESARDMAIKAVEEEIAHNLEIFRDFLINYINFGGQGLHRMDIDIGFTLILGTPPENRTCTLFIEGLAHPLPQDIGHALMEKLVDMAGGNSVSFPRQMIEVYKKIEGHYDLVSGGDLERCSLNITEELFPCTCYHVRVRFPALIFLEDDLVRLAGS
jgi:hypothetical protein